MNKTDIIDHMVDRFLSWKLPKDFQPDQGITFNQTSPQDYETDRFWPIGTNLFTADQARAMIGYMLEDIDTLAIESSSVDAIMNQVNILCGEIRHDIDSVEKKYIQLRDMIDKSAGNSIFSLLA
jgi:hypothetical protein